MCKKHLVISETPLYYVLHKHIVVASPGPDKHGVQAEPGMGYLKDRDLRHSLTEGLAQGHGGWNGTQLCYIIKCCINKTILP